MPTKQELDSPHQNSNVSDSIPHQHQTVLAHRHRSHHRIAKKRRARCHTNHSQSQLLTSSTLPPLLHHDYWCWHRPTVSGTPIQMVRTSTEDHQRLRSPLYIPLRTRVNQGPGNQSKSVNGIPPSDQWPIRTDESMGRTVPTSYHHQPEQMEQVATHGDHSPQQ
jgi:hypothetical protein